MNTGHGYVYARSDGVKARCGGPGLCAQCNRELAAAKAASTAMQMMPAGDAVLDPTLTINCAPVKVCPTCGCISVTAGTL